MGIFYLHHEYVIDLNNKSSENDNYFWKKLLRNATVATLFLPISALMKI